MIGKPIESVTIERLTEAGKGHSWWVTLTNTKGQTLTPFRSYVEAETEGPRLAWIAFLGLDGRPDPTPIATVRVEPGPGGKWKVVVANSAGETTDRFTTTERDHALIEADTWASFLGIEAEPLVVDGEVVRPSMRMLAYEDD